MENEKKLEQQTDPYVGRSTLEILNVGVMRDRADSLYRIAALENLVMSYKTGFKAFEEDNLVLIAAGNGGGKSLVIAGERTWNPDMTQEETKNEKADKEANKKIG